ncbi:hypothetical protein PR048_032770 [Dryococelus australis]|uniref:Uncharacterized protein n=1 Tax=Dryococelus australis TaxID=614101 RepID=A0ABQ9G6B4_9NEOP|nr:hypothetical protein PR048_032770 [Dryococelus australis]
MSEPSERTPARRGGNMADVCPLRRGAEGAEMTVCVCVCVCVRARILGWVRVQAVMTPGQKHIPALVSPSTRPFPTSVDSTAVTQYREKWDMSRVITAAYPSFHRPIRAKQIPSHRVGASRALHDTLEARLSESACDGEEEEEYVFVYKENKNIKNCGIEAILYGTKFCKSLCKVCHSCRYTSLYGTPHGIFRLALPDFTTGLVIGPVLFSVAGSMPALVPGQSHCSFRAWGAPRVGTS